jgi:hypothetical protein
VPLFLESSSGDPRPADNDQLNMMTKMELPKTLGDEAATSRR